MTAEEIGAEQRYVDRLYQRLDELRERTAAELAAIRREGASGSHQARSERDSFAALREARLAQLQGVEERLAFGRLDLRGGERRYVGRLGLFDDEQRQLLLDWRAPAATDFYQATARHPGEVVRRRHLTTRARTVTAIEDDVLDLAALGEDAAGLSGEGALLAAVNASRTGRMGDIVATIQAEQDRIIRSDLRGVLVVQGGPGTGKTAVALHRAAYLLYTHRAALERSGVLLVGPSPVFLRYIERVLPSLGETGVVMSTPADLYPGVHAVAAGGAAAARLKGDLRMAEVVVRAVRQRVRLPDGDRELDVEGVRIVMPRAMVQSAVDRARRTGRKHNAARVSFVLDMLQRLADLVERELGHRLGSDDRSGIIEDLRGSKDVRRELNLAWPPLTPTGLLSDLFANDARLRSATPGWSERDRDLLRRPRDSAWTLSDVPLLDEAAELLGDDDEAARMEAQRAAAQRAQEVAYAREVLGTVGGQAAALITAEQLADRFAERGPELTVAERAGRDRSWEFGHVVVDEAQELSPMMWRLLFRRCPSASMTVVGDVGQTSDAAGATSWEAVFAPHVGDRWRQVDLTINYRTPADVMELAHGVLVVAGFDLPMPRSVRRAEVSPRAVHVSSDEREARAAFVEVVRRELAAVGDGRIAVLGPEGDGLGGQARRVAALREAEAAGDLPPGSVGAGERGLDASIAVLTAREAKGLEFDAVIVVEPAAISSDGDRGVQDLYVALTRPTQRLTVLHARELPAALRVLQTERAA
ncbi:MAG: HelD family protein [Actinomycetes bacterium]